jgi:hypothetical protein
MKAMRNRADIESRTRKWERRVEEWFARRHGYSWVDCPLCGDPFRADAPSVGINHIPADLPADASPGVRVTIGQRICARCACDRLKMAEELLRDLGENISFNVQRGDGRTIWHHVPGGFEQPDIDRQENP